MKTPKKYYIQIVYDTGDSFHRERDVISGVSELDWDNLDNAKMNLKWLEENYDVYLKTRDFGRMYYDQKEIKEFVNNAKTAKWYNTQYTDVCMNMFDDNNEIVMVSTFWTGYFERLNSAEIKEKMPENKGMKFEPR